MNAVVSHPATLPELLPGIRHRTLAGPDDGLSSLEVWSQSIAGHGATPPHQHDCEEVVLILAGRGLLAMNGTDMPFQAGDTLIIPRGVAHQILNDGEHELRLFAALGMAPVRAAFPDGTPIALPWQQRAATTAAAAACVQPPVRATAARASVSDARSPN